jgi:hypothetical protein
MNFSNLVILRRSLESVLNDSLREVSENCIPMNKMLITNEVPQSTGHRSTFRRSVPIIRWNF